MSGSIMFPLVQAKNEAGHMYVVPVPRSRRETRVMGPASVSNEGKGNNFDILCARKVHDVDFKVGLVSQAQVWLVFELLGSLRDYAGGVGRFGGRARSFVVPTTPPPVRRPRMIAALSTLTKSSAPRKAVRSLRSEIALSTNLLVRS